MPSGRHWNPCCWSLPSEDRSTAMTCARSSMRCSTSRTHRLPMALPARRVRSLDQGLVPISLVVEERNGTRVLTALHASSRTALGRREPRPSMVVIDTHFARGASNGGATFPQTRVAPTVGPTGPSASSAWTSPGYRSACASSPLRPPRPVPSNRYSTTSLEPVRTNDSSSCSSTAALPSPRPCGCRRSSTTRSAEWDGMSLLETTKVPRSFALSATPGESKSPTATSCAGDVWRAVSRTP